MKKNPVVSLMMIAFLLWACSMPARISRAPLQPDDSDIYFENAEALFREQSHEDALEAYSMYLSRFPKGASADLALKRIATIYSYRGDREAQLEAYRRLVCEFPDSTYVLEAEYEIMTSLYHEGKIEDVVRRASAIIAKTDSKALLSQTYKILGDTYLSLGSTVEAVFFYYSAYEKADSSQQENITNKLACVVNLLNRDDMTSVYNNLGQDSLKGHFLYLLSTVEYERGNYAEAKKKIQRFVEAFPQHTWVEQARLRIEEIDRKTAFQRERIGCMLPLSGPYAAFGNKALKGIKLAVERFNSQGGRPQWELIVRDTGSDPDTVASLVQELDTQKVALIIGPMVTSKNAAAEAQKREISIITLTQQAGVPEIGEYVFRNFLTPDMQVETLLACAIDKFGASRFAILYPEEAYGKTYMELFRDRATYYGAQVVGIASYAPDQTDFSIPIKRLAKISAIQEDQVAAPHRWQAAGIKNRLKTEPFPLDFDAIFIPDEPSKAALIAPQLAYWDVNRALLMGTNLWHSDHLIAKARDYVQDAILADVYYAKSINQTVRRFIQSFEELYGESPGPFEGLAYDTAMIAFQTAANPEIRSRKDLRDLLARTADFEGVTGRTSFKANGDAWKKLYLLQINGADFVELN